MTQGSSSFPGAAPAPNPLPAAPSAASDPDSDSDPIETLPEAFDPSRPAEIVDPATVRRAENEAEYVEKLGRLGIGFKRVPYKRPVAVPKVDGHDRYRLSGYGIEELRLDRNGQAVVDPVSQEPVYGKLTNFDCVITAAVHRVDGGGEPERFYELSISKGGRGAPNLLIEANRFATMSWATDYPHLGLIVNPGMGVKDRARAAIQYISGEPTVKTTYTHTGWQTVNRQRVFLHGDGAIGESGAVEGVGVGLDHMLANFRLPIPADKDGPEAREAVRASLRMLDVGPDTVMVPLLLGAYRAPIGDIGLTEHLYGRTGQFKTTRALLAQQHFGGGFSMDGLPSFESTANALELLAYLAKDVLFLVDDLKPDDPAGAAVARRLMHNQGNRVGRSRMARTATGTLPTFEPRGLLLTTGEELPEGWSTSARVLTIDVPPDSADMGALNAAQADAAAGLYALAMSGYVEMLAAVWDEAQAHVARRLRALREKYTDVGEHRRTPEMIAQLMIGAHYLLFYAQEVGAIDEDEAQGYWVRFDTALSAVAVSQRGYLDEVDPTERFFRLIVSALASGQVKLDPIVILGSDVRPAPLPGTDHSADDRRRRIGWVEGDDVYLIADEAYAVAVRLSREQKRELGLSDRSLWKTMAERGMLRSREGKRETLKVRRSIGGQRIGGLIHVGAEHLMGDSESAEWDSPERDGTSSLFPADEIAAEEGFAPWS